MEKEASDELLAVDDATVGYSPAVPIVRLGSFGLRQCESLVLLGPSGSGKSTILLTIVGLLKPLAGSFMFNDSGAWLNITEEPSNGQLRSIWPMVTMVFQDLQLFPNLTGRENCEIGVRTVRSCGDEVEVRTTNLANALSVEDCLANLPSKMSHGQRQRIAIVRALVRQPLLLLLDEPTAALDSVARERLLELLASESTKRGMATIAATHDISFASALNGQYLALESGGATRTDSFASALKIYTKRG